MKKISQNSASYWFICSIQEVEFETGMEIHQRGLKMVIVTSEVGSIQLDKREEKVIAMGSFPDWRFYDQQGFNLLLMEPM